MHKTMIVRSLKNVFYRNFFVRWQCLGRVSGQKVFDRGYVRDVNPEKDTSYLPQCHYIKLLKRESPFRTINSNLSTSARHYGVSDKLSSYYSKRDMFRLKRKEFYTKFSAARFVNAAPESWKPYLYMTRVDKPIGTWLLYLPCALSICLATPLGSLPDLYYLGLFGVGAFLMRSAGCIINDLWDKDLDKLVERTRNRPLASGELKPKNAIAMLAVQLSLSLGILLSLNTTCIIIGVASMVPVILYPLAKRVTYFPQAVLGVTFNIGAIMGYTAVAGHIDWQTVLPLYIGCFLWTMYYDTIYAVQDAADDAVVGIKSTALLFLASKNMDELSKLPIGERLQEMNESRGRLEKSLAFCHLMTMIFWITSFYYTGVVTFGYVVPVVQLMKCRPEDHSVSDTQECWEKFVQSKNTGLMVLMGIIVGIYFAPTIGETAEDGEFKTLDMN